VGGGWFSKFRHLLVFYSSATRASNNELPDHGGSVSLPDKASEHFAALLENKSSSETDTCVQYALKTV